MAEELTIDDLRSLDRIPPRAGPLPSCGVCGAALTDPQRHRDWHLDLG